MQELTRAARNHQRAAAHLDQARAQLTAAALDQLRAGAAPTEVARIAGWSAAYLRRVARAAGIAPARPAR